MKYQDFNCQNNLRMLWYYNVFYWLCAIFNFIRKYHPNLRVFPRHIQKGSCYELIMDDETFKKGENENKKKSN